MSSEGKSAGGESDSPEKPRFVVQQGTGNARHGSISHYPDEQEQAVLDVITWFYDKAPEEKELLGKIKGATPEAMGALSKVAADGAVPVS